MFIGERKRAQPCLLNLSNFRYSHDVCTYESVKLRNVAVTSRRNVIIIIARKEGGAWERTPQAVEVA